MLETHDFYMKLAIEEAAMAARAEEVPVGAVLIDEFGNVLARDRNRVISLCDPTAHAEMLALRKGAEILGNYRLLNTVLYVTVEPCVMCMGAVIHARVSAVVFGAMDPRWGAAGSLYNFAENAGLNHKPEIINGICRDECRNLIQSFFREKRNGA